MIIASVSKHHHPLGHVYKAISSSSVPSISYLGLKRSHSKSYFSTTKDTNSSFNPIFKINDLRDNPGAKKSPKRKGRGEGSGMGRLSGRGLKGTTGREGGSVPLGFEGGQTPMWRRSPKIGYMTKVNRTPLETVNLDILGKWIDTGRIDPLEKITIKTLVDTQLVTKTEFGVKLLGRGNDIFNHKIDIEVTQASKSAIEAIEKAGGSIKSVFYTPLALRSMLKPYKFDIPISSPRPPPKKIAYYLDKNNRGYLSSEVQLMEVQRRLQNGLTLEEATKIMPRYAGGYIIDDGFDNRISSIEEAFDEKVEATEK